MQIDGSALGQRFAASMDGGGKAGGAGNSYDVQIRRLQEQREEYVEKINNVREETSDPEQAERLAQMYQMTITSINGRIAQLEKAKVDDAQRKTEERQAKVEPSREADASGKTGGISKTKESKKPESAPTAEEDRDGNDPFALRKDEELFWIDGEGGSWPGKKRKPEYPSVLVDISI